MGWAVREAVLADAPLIAALARRLGREEGQAAGALRPQDVRAHGFGAARRFRVVHAGPR